MKLYAVCRCWKYGGYGSPSGIYTDRAQALAIAEELAASKTLNDVRVFELTLDAAPTTANWIKR